MALVSVIIPTYNRAHVIGRALDSVLQQSYEPIEIIVVDDGSTDNTQSVLVPYADRITYIHQENGGAAKARNTGIKACTGDFINFLDSDDKFLPDKLAKQMQYFTDHPQTDVVLCGLRFLNAKTEELESEVTELPVDNLFIHFLEVGTVGLLYPHQAVLRKKVIEKSGFFDEKLPIREEQEFWSRVMLSGSQIGMVNEVLCLYFNHPEGKGKNWAKLEAEWPKILDRIFAHPNLPAEALSIRAEVYAFSQIEFALYHAQQPNPDWETIPENIAQAIGDPQLIIHWKRDIFDKILYTAMNISPEKPFQALNLLMAKVKKGSWLDFYLMSQLHRILAFRAYETRHYGQVVRHSLAGFRHNLRFFNDRGTIAIVMRSFIKSIFNRDS